MKNMNMNIKDITKFLKRKGFMKDSLLQQIF